MLLNEVRAENLAEHAATLYAMVQQQMGSTRIQIR